ncbi:MAG: nitrophenyl compound nitroreductase subunit ArsF family protein [Parabacteroides sp.]
MRKILVCMVLCLLAISTMAQTHRKDCVEVMYFHGKQRCVTCLAIEKHAREVVEQEFANEQKQGRVVFKIIDMATPEGKKTAQDYRVTWSSLYVNRWQEGQEKRYDMTQFAFKNARKYTDEFKK